MLTFCCQEATVITNFSDLAAVGRDHYMNLHGGCATVAELEALNGEETARQLIESGSGTVTPYGVVYDNGMKLEQVYDGQFFPCYYYEPHATTVAVTSKSEPENTDNITWLYLPMAQEEIDRALQRAGITDFADLRLRLEDSQLPNKVLQPCLLSQSHGGNAPSAGMRVVRRRIFGLCRGRSSVLLPELCQCRKDCAEEFSKRPPQASEH